MNKSIVLLSLLMVSGAVQAIETQTIQVIANTARVCATHAAAFIFAKIQRRWMLREVQPYSADELADLKRIVEPYVSTDALNTILGCIRKPTYFSQLSFPCSYNNLIIINPNIRLQSACDLTDVEFAYIVLHEYGHIVHGDVSPRKDLTNMLKGLSLQLPLIAFQLYKPNLNHTAIQQTVAYAYSIGSIFFTRAHEYAADDYAFNALKADAPAGCMALEKLYRAFHFTIAKKIDEKPYLRSRVKMTVFDFIHPTLWTRYQRACTIAKKYGWKKPELTVAFAGDIAK